MKTFASRAFIAVAVGGMVLAGAASAASAAPGPGSCPPPGHEFISGAAEEAGPNSGPNGNQWGPTRDGKPASPGQAVVGACLLGFE
jgi:hypothetical protein